MGTNDRSRCKTSHFRTPRLPLINFCVDALKHFLFPILSSSSTRFFFYLILILLVSSSDKNRTHLQRGREHFCSGGRLAVHEHHQGKLLCRSPQLVLVVVVTLVHRRTHRGSFWIRGRDNCGALLKKKKKKHARQAKNKHSFIQERGDKKKWGADPRSASMQQTSDRHHSHHPPTGNTPLY